MAKRNSTGALPLNDEAQRIIQRVCVNARQQPEPQAFLKDIARGTTITGRILESLSDRYNLPGKRYPRIIVSMGLTLWGIIELSAPRKIGEIFFRYWLSLAMLVGLTVFLLGVFVATPKMWGTGLAVIVIAIVLGMFKYVLRSYMSGMGWPRMASYAGVYVFAMVVIALGATAWFGEEIAGGFDSAGQELRGIAWHAHHPMAFVHRLTGKEPEGGHRSHAEK